MVRYTTRTTQTVCAGHFWGMLASQSLSPFHKDNVFFPFSQGLLIWIVSGSDMMKIVKYKLIARFRVSKLRTASYFGCSVLLAALKETMPGPS